MGLDMYLEAHRESYKSKYSTEGMCVYPEELKPFLDDVSLPFESSVTKYCIGYWRKANAIHAWFIKHCADGIDECQPIEVSLDDLIQLQHTCKRVLAEPELAKKELPVAEGFFFGSDTYDEYYRDTVAYTCRVLDKAIKLVHDHGDQYRIVYQASW